MAEARKLGGAASAKVKLDDAAFGAPFNGPLVHESVRAELAARRQGTPPTQIRGLARGGGRGRGTRRARGGAGGAARGGRRRRPAGGAGPGGRRAPLEAGGGVVWGPPPRHYTFKVNRKERRAALRSALSVHAERGTVAV